VRGGGGRRSPLPEYFPYPVKFYIPLLEASRVCSGVGGSLLLLSCFSLSSALWGVSALVSLSNPFALVVFSSVSRFLEGSRVRRFSLVIEFLLVFSAFLA